MERLRSLGRPKPWVGVAIDALEAAVVVWREHRVTEGAVLARETLEEARRLTEQGGGIARLNAAERRAYLAAILDRLRGRHSGRAVEVARCVGRGGDQGGPRPRGGPDRSTGDARPGGPDKRPLQACSGRLSTGVGRGPPGSAAGPGGNRRKLGRAVDVRPRSNRRGRFVGRRGRTTGRTRRRHIAAPRCHPRGSPRDRADPRRLAHSRVRTSCRSQGTRSPLRPGGPPVGRRLARPGRRARAG